MIKACFCRKLHLSALYRARAVIKGRQGNTRLIKIYGIILLVIFASVLIKIHNYDRANNY